MRAPTTAPPRVRRGTGRRAQQRRERRRRRVRRLATAAVVVAAAAVLAALAGPALTRLWAGPTASDPAPPAEPAADAAPDDPLAGDPQATLALVSTSGDGEPLHVALLGVTGDDGDDATMLVAPASLVVDVPGLGLASLARAEVVGGEDLVGVALQDLLGVEVDGVATLAPDDWERALTAAGADVDLDPLVTAPGPGVPAPRAAARAETALQDVVAALGAAPDRIDLPLGDRAVAVVAAYARAAADGRADGFLTPLTPFGDDGGHRADEARLHALVDDRFAASRPETTVAVGRRLQILNGVGAPGIGRVVAERAVPLGFDVLLSGNAATFEVAETRILVFDDDPDTVAAARALQRALGVGVVERSAAPQTVVDLTVVAGADLLD